LPSDDVMSGQNENIQLVCVNLTSALNLIFGRWQRSLSLIIMLSDEIDSRG